MRARSLLLSGTACALLKRRCAWIVQGKRMRRPTVFAMLVALMSAPAHSSETISYSYDALGRLVATTMSGGPNNGQQTSTTFDPAGNRTGMAVGAPFVPPPNAAIFSISNAADVDEGSPAIFLVTRTGTASTPLTVNYATVIGTAGAGDFTATSGTLTFQPSQTGLQISVPTLPDSISEPAEQFSMTLSSPSVGATLGTPTAAATIRASVGPNQSPIANTDTGTVGRCMTVTLNVVANDTDPDGNTPLSIVSVGTPSRGTATVIGTTSVRYHSSGAVGADSFSYVVQDSLGATAFGTIQINVTSGTGCQ